MILIISKKEIKKDEVVVINNKITMIDDYHLKLNDEIIQFDYLIIEDLELVLEIEKANFLIDDKVPVTNFFGQTSKEHIYVGDIENALDHLYNGD